MDLLEEKFKRINSESAPGQEVRNKNTETRLDVNAFKKTPIDFSHGDVDAFQPVSASIELFTDGFEVGGKQAYTEYRGKMEIREELAKKLSQFTGASIDAEDHFIITPGTQGALFLAAGATITTKTKVAIVMPDYFANRKIVEFLNGEIYPIEMDYLHTTSATGDRKSVV